jgi:hypothetical protein
MTTVLLTLAIMGLCLFGLAIGVLLNGMVIQGSCGGASSVLGEDSCACGRRSRDVCPSEDKSGLVALAEIGNPSREVRHTHGKGLKV